jgi:hypothetical protein
LLVADEDDDEVGAVAQETLVALACIARVERTHGGGEAFFRAGATRSDGDVSAEDLILLERGLMRSDDRTAEPSARDAGVRARAIFDPGDFVRRRRLIGVLDFAALLSAGRGEIGGRARRNRRFIRRAVNYALRTHRQRKSITPDQIFGSRSGALNL